MASCSSGQANTQPAWLSERTGSLCDIALDAGEVCCSSLSLDKVERDLRGLASSSSQCFSVRQRIQCAEACDPERTGWWDPTAGTDGVAHLCDSLCEQLYTFCYQNDGQTLSYPNRNVAEFCATHTGVNRSDTNACLGPLSTATTPTVTVFTTITSADLFTGPVSAPTVSPGALSASPSPPTDEADGPGSIVAMVVVLVVLAIVCAGGCWVWNNKARRERPKAQPVPPPRGGVPNKPQPSAALVARRESEPATAAAAGNRRRASDLDDSTSNIGSATSVDAAIAHHTAVVAGTAAARARAAEERAVAAEERAAEAEARAEALEDLARQGAPPEAAREEAEAPPRYTSGNSGGSCTAAAAAATAEERRSAAAEGRRAAAQRRADAAGSQELRAMEAEGGGAGAARASSSSSSSSCGNAQAGSGAEAEQDGGGKWGKVRRGGKVERGDGADRQPGRLRRQVSDTVSKIGSRVQTQQMAQEDARKQEARLQKAKQEAARRIKIWQEKHRDIYSLLESLRGFGPPLFPKDPLGGATLERNARSLRKAYHKCAARLHPDKVHGESVQVRALAEELFKALGEAYAAETSRLEAVDNALSA